MNALIQTAEQFEMRVEVLRRARRGLGWEDICRELRICDRAVRAQVREIVLEGAYDVPPVQPWIR